MENEVESFAWPFFTSTVEVLPFSVKMTLPTFKGLLFESYTLATMSTFSSTIAFTFKTVIFVGKITLLTVTVDLAEDEE